MKRDVAASGAAMTEDFSWYTVKEDGPKEMVRGREATMARQNVLRLPHVDHE